MPPGVRLEDTERVSAQAYQIVKKHKEVANVVESIGGGDTGEVRNATLYVSLVPAKERELGQQQWERLVLSELKQIPDARINFQNTQGASEGRDLTFYLTGDDPALVESTSAKVIAEMQALPELREPRINGDLQRPEIIIHPRFDLAAELGVTVQSISQTIRIATIGDIPQNAAKFSLSDRQVPIRVSLLEDARRDLSTLRESPRAYSHGRSRAAEGRRRYLVRTGSHSRTPLQPEPPRGAGSRPERR